MYNIKLSDEHFSEKQADINATNIFLPCKKLEMRPDQTFYIF